MLMEDVKVCESLKKIVTRLTADQSLQEDLMQECRIRMWRLENERPGRTRSWYLQNCRFHVQHWLAAGRSVDSPKRANGETRIPIDGVNDDLPADWYHTNGEAYEIISAHDIVATLACRLKPRENAVLGGLAEGRLLRDVATQLDLSYPTALKYRRKIAALSVKLGIALARRSSEVDAGRMPRNHPSQNGQNGSTSTKHRRHSANGLRANRHPRAGAR